MTSCSITINLNLKTDFNYEKEKKNGFPKERKQKKNEKEKLLHSFQRGNTTMSYYTQCIDVRTRKIKGVEHSFPCGQCGNCRHRIMSEWIARNALEWRDSISAYFVTLTYEDSQLPIYDIKTKRPSLYYKDVTDFLKRLRKYQNKKGWVLEDSKKQPKKLRYFYVGEYGKQDLRPHYHMILYNCSWQLADKIVLIWKKGIIDYSPLQSERAITYTAKYAFKQHWNDDMHIKPRPFMSQQIGLDYAIRNNLVENGLLNMGTYKIPIPKSWIKHFYDEDTWHDIKVNNDESSFLALIKEESTVKFDKIKYPSPIDFMKFKQLETSKTRYKNGLK